VTKQTELEKKIAGVFAAVKAEIVAQTDIRNVNTGETIRILACPYAILNLEASPAKPVSRNPRAYEVSLTFSVICVIRETEPDNWLLDVIPQLCAVVEALLSDESAAGTLQSLSFTGLAPSEVKVRAKTYYGGACQFVGSMLYTPEVS
jgi:hypothetical protein